MKKLLLQISLMMPMVLLVATKAYGQKCNVEFGEYMTVPDATVKELKYGTINFIVKEPDGGYFTTLCTRIYEPVAHIKEVKVDSLLNITDNKEVKEYDTRKVYPNENYEKTNPWGARLYHINNIFSLNNHGTPVYKYFIQGEGAFGAAETEYNSINRYGDNLTSMYMGVPQVISGNRKYAMIQNYIVNLDDGTSRDIGDMYSWSGITDDGMRYMFGVRPYVEVDTGRVYVRKSQILLFWKHPGCEMDSKGNQEWTLAERLPIFLISFENGEKAVFGTLYERYKKWNPSGPLGFCTIEFDIATDTYRKVQQIAFPKAWKEMGKIGNKTYAECFTLNDGVLLRYEYGYRPHSIFEKDYNYHTGGRQDYHLYIGVNKDGTIASSFDGVVGDEHMITNFSFRGLYYEVTYVPIPNCKEEEKYQLLLTWYNKYGKQGEQTLCKLKTHTDYINMIRMGEGVYEIVQLSKDHKRWRRGQMNLNTVHNAPL